MNAIERARARLRAADVFFYNDPAELDSAADLDMLQTINLSDTWGYAEANGEYVPDDELPELSRLHWRYGWCGVLYWVSERRGRCRSEFPNINRFIEFVRQEEAAKQMTFGPPVLFRPVCIRHPHGYYGGPAGYERTGDKNAGPLVLREEL